MTVSTSEVAVCCSRASASSRLHDSSCCSRSAGGLRVRSACVFAFVPVERSLRRRVGLFAPLRDKATPGAARRSAETFLATDVQNISQRGSAVCQPFAPAVRGARTGSAAWNFIFGPGPSVGIERGVAEGREAHGRCHRDITRRRTPGASMALTPSTTHGGHPASRGVVANQAAREALSATLTPSTAAGGADDDRCTVWPPAIAAATSTSSTRCNSSSSRSSHGDATARGRAVDAPASSFRGNSKGWSPYDRG